MIKMDQERQVVEAALEEGYGELLYWNERLAFRWHNRKQTAAIPRLQGQLRQS